MLLASLYRFRPIAEYNPADGTREWRRQPFTVLFFSSSYSSIGTIALACSWSVVELAAGVISACLPTLRPLVRKASNQVGKTIKSRIHTGNTQMELIATCACGSQADLGGAKPRRDPFQRLGTSHSEARFMYPGEEHLVASPCRSSFPPVPPVPVPASPSSRGSRGLSGSGHGNPIEDLIIQVNTEVTVSIDPKRTERDEICPWESVVISAGTGV